jgi:hypothetical protein
LDLIRAVPNPYLAYNYYESSQLDNRIKIINLPNRCTVSIYSVDGQLINRLDRNVGANVELTDGNNLSNDNEVNETNAIEWNLKNFDNVPISSGVYLIHVDAPGIGERTIKWFGALRPVDLRSF